MGTVPAPNIVEAAQQISQNPLTEQARAVQLQGEQQQVKQQQIQTQMQQQQLQDQQAMTKAMQSWDGKDFSQLPELMRQNGISAPGYINAQNSILQRRQQLMTLDKEQLSSMEAHHDAALGIIDSAKQVPDSELPQHISDTVQQLQSQGHLSPQEAQAVIQHSQSMPPDQFRPWLDVYEKGLMGEKEQIAQAAQQRELKVKEETAASEQTKAGADQQKANAADWKDFPTLGVALNTRTGEQRAVSGAGGMMPPGMMEAKYVALQAKQNAGQKLSAEDGAWKKAYEHFKTLVPTTTLNLQAGLLTPQAKQMLGNTLQETGQLPPGLARAPGMVAGVVNQAAGPAGSAVPDLGAAKRTFGAESALQKSAVAGEIGKNVTAFNTAIAHAQQLRQAADALDNGDIRALNTIGNQIGFQFGSDKTTNFNVIKNALAGEISKVFKGGEATDAEIKAVQEPFSNANSPAQLKGAIDNAVHLMNSKRDALKQQYEQGMKGQPNFSGGQKDFFQQFDGKARQ